MLRVPLVRLFLQTDPPLPDDAGHLLRGCIANLFPDDDCIHNHDVETGAERYRYPLVQFKIIEQNSVIVGALEEGTMAVKKIFTRMPDHLHIGQDTVHIIKCVAESTTETVGDAAQFLEYRFLSPWIGLNAENFQIYKCMGTEERPALLAQCLVNNCLSFAKGMRYRVEQTLQAVFQGQSQPVNLKGAQMVGFQGNFLLNFIIPDLLGIGKSVSRGYGCVGKASVV